MTGIPWPAPLGLAVVGAVWGTRVWRRRLLAGVTLRHAVEPGMLFPGDRGLVHVTLENPKALSIPWLVTADELDTGIEVEGVFTVHGRGNRNTWAQAWRVPGWRRIRRTFSLVGVDRGWHPFGPVSLQAGDPMGLTSVRVEIGEDTSLQHDGVVVLPRPFPVSSVGMLTPAGEQAARGWLYRDPLNVVGARPYMAGDRFRDIDWKVSSHRGALHVRETAPWRAPSLELAVDIATMEPFWLGIVRPRLEAVLGVAAWLALDAAAHGGNVGLMANGGLRGKGADVLLPGRRGGGPVHVLEALGRLAPVVRQPLTATLLGRRRVDREARLVIVTSLPRADLWQAAHTLSRRPLVIGVGAEAEHNPYTHLVVPESEVNRWWEARPRPAQDSSPAA